MNEAYKYLVVPTLFCVGLFARCGTSAAQPPSDPNPSQVQTGTIEGVVIYESDRQRPWRYRRNYVRSRSAGELAEAVVSLVRGDQSFPQHDNSNQQTRVDQKDYNFIPETQAIYVGTEVTFTNSDPFLHDVTAKNPSQRFSISLRQFDKVKRVLNEPGDIDDPLALTCAFHSAMRGWIFIFDHACFAVTAESGKFRLSNVPVGKQTVVVVHPAGQLKLMQEVDVKPNEITRVEMRLSPDHLVADKEQ